MTCDLYYKPITIVNDDSRVINKLEASLSDDTRAVSNDCHMFIAQATGYSVIINFDTFSVASSTFNDKFKKMCCSHRHLIHWTVYFDLALENLSSVKGAPSCGKTLILLL